MEFPTFHDFVRNQVRKGVPEFSPTITRKRSTAPLTGGGHNVRSLSYKLTVCRKKDNSDTLIPDQSDPMTYVSVVEVVEVVLSTKPVLLNSPMLNPIFKILSDSF